jgi:hypothetical protein
MPKEQRAPDTQGDQNRERVAQRAYERWEARGREDGRDQEDWFEAEREIGHGSSGQGTADRSQRRGGTNEGGTNEAA